MDQKFKCECGALFTRKNNIRRHKRESCRGTTQEKTHCECEGGDGDGFRRECCCIEMNQNENTKKKGIDPGLLWEAFQEKDGYGLFYDIMNPKSTTKKRKTETESSLESKEKKSFDEDGFLIGIGHPPPPPPKKSDSTTKFDEIEWGEE